MTAQLPDHPPLETPVETVQLAFEAAADALVILSNDGLVLHTNAAGLQLIEADSAQAARGIRLIDLLLPEFHDEWHRLRERAAAGESCRLSVELVGLRGAQRWVEVHASPMRIANGGTGLLAVCRDSTAEGPPGAAALTQARLAALVECCDDAIISKSIDGIVTSWNSGAERLFGYTAAESIGRSILAIVPPERRDEEMMILNRLCGGERISHFETQRLTKDGRVIDVSITVSPIRNHHGVIVGASKIVRAIGDKLRLEEQRERLLEAERHAREEAQKASLVKDEFLATLSHELRTPLAAIQAWGHLLAMGRVKVEEMRHAGEVIERNAGVQKRVIEDLLDVSRIVSGRLRLEFVDMDPAAVLRAALDTVEPAAIAKGIRVRNLISESPVILRGDPARLQQVIWNLLLNAIKFTPSGGEVRVALEPAESNVRLTISDNGVGIEPEFLPRIFQRFSQGDTSLSRKHGGLGLGLAIAKQITELHGGSIRARSAGKGQGASFVVELPRQHAPAHSRGPSEEPVPWTAEIAEGESINLSSISVLIVDDEPDTRLTLERILRDAGADVTAVESAVAALAFIALKMPDVLVSDIGMPEMDGYEMLRRIRSVAGNASTLPAIALTAFARPNDRINALRAGYVAHLTKPADPSQLIATLAAVANRSTSTAG